MKTATCQRTRGFFVVLAVSSQVGCSPSSELAWLKTLGGPIVLGAFKWMFALGFLGLTLALLGVWTLRKSGLLAAEGKVAKLVRFISLIALLVVLPSSFAAIGFFEGLLRASAHELSEGQFADEYFPVIGSAGADLVGTVLLTGDPTTLTADSAPDGTAAITAAFRSGEKEIRTSEIPALIAAIDTSFVGDISDDIKAGVQERVPKLREGTGKQILDWLFDNFGDALARAALTGEIEDRGLGSVLDLYGEMIRQLPDAAARDGRPETLSHQDISAFIVEATVADGVVFFVIKPFCRAHQIAAAIPMLLCLFIPIAVLRSPGLVMKSLSWVASKRHPDATPATDDEDRSPIE